MPVPDIDILPSPANGTGADSGGSPSPTINGSVGSAERVTECLTSYVEYLIGRVSTATDHYRTMAGQSGNGLNGSGENGVLADYYGVIADFYENLLPRMDELTAAIGGLSADTFGTAAWSEQVSTVVQQIITATQELRTLPQSQGGGFLRGLPVDYLIIAGASQNDIDNMLFPNTAYPTFDGSVYYGPFDQGQADSDISAGSGADPGINSPDPSGAGNGTSSDVSAGGSGGNPSTPTTWDNSTGFDTPWIFNDTGDFETSASSSVYGFFDSYGTVPAAAMAANGIAYDWLGPVLNGEQAAFTSAAATPANTDISPVLAAAPHSFMAGN